MNLEEIMTSNPITVNPKTPIYEITNILYITKISGIYIIESGKIVGIVTRNDLKFRGKGKSNGVPVSEIMSINVYSIDCNAVVKEAVLRLDRFKKWDNRNRS